ncbi:tRNA pseudouridine55 synthase [Elusimicrobium simillimum]|uniref:tRNA pseudouridine(55) synthase TruB n=1 Tax=Elusimicrobium simillimum TaxID=3143438 RepID=UPI003C7044B2
MSTETTLTADNPCPNGILLIDKPADWTSHDVIAVARRALGLRKIGHAGTLDPMATGLLVLLVGRQATKLQSDFFKFPKSYKAQAHLGIETETWDAHGATLSETIPPPVTLEQAQAEALKLTGTFEHIVPFYSAKKVFGKPMHRHMREGKMELDEKKAVITVYKWEDIAVDGDKINFSVNVSSGTYVRSLAYMLGRALDTVAHLSELRRTTVGDYNVGDAITVEYLRTAPQEELFKHIKIL